MFENFFGFFWIFWGEILEFVLKFFGNLSEGFFREDFFRRNSLFYFNVEGIDFFVKILVFVKILSESTRKEGGQNLDP